MSDYVKLTLAATTLAVRDAGIVDAAEFAGNCAAVLGTTHGSSNYSISYYKQIVSEGILAANPMLFAEAVPNGGVAQLSLMLSLKGACQTIIGTRTAGLDAIALACARIRSGAWDRAIVGAGEEYCDVVCEAYRHCTTTSADEVLPFVGAGAATFILESRESMENRGGKPRGKILQTAASFGHRQQITESVANVLKRLGNPALRRDDNNLLVSSIYGHIAETFSVSPLVAIASALLSNDENAVDFATICTDISGAVSGMRVAVL
ncbi:MAG TPA: beta-ketoacyl synthase N-terminal-like domain-containing protein, partial [Tepidisphaeraceae bacterium]|nr:beta-ketoacyl synthase N-terminal-like domain-containing protein [Tepidisphaeraceae bacterium]